METITAIILAAGQSKRFGSDKRLQVIDGVPMLLRVALLYRGIVPNTTVMLGPNDHQHAELLALHGIPSHLVQESAGGMGCTLAYAVHQYPRAKGWLITPADLPFIKAATIQKVVDASLKQALAAPVHKGRRGHPVWFHRDYLPDLSSLSGDTGARTILTAHQHELHLIDVDDAGCVHDIDRASDFSSYEARK